MHLDVIIHIPLIKIIKNFSLLNSDEIKFVRNPNSHIDFIIYSKINKQIILCIEVDGYQYHENNLDQLKRDKIKNSILDKYNIPLERFATNHSQEIEKLKNCLKNLV